MLSRATEIYREEGGATLARKSIRFLHRNVDDLSTPVTNRYFDAQYSAGESVLEKDWDNLLLFDACRYDVFQQLCPFPESMVDRRVTVGSCTPEYLHRTFDGTTCHDIVYVTANPQPLKYIFERDEMPFHAMVSVLNQWDSETQTVEPPDVCEAARRAESRYPDKRLIVHFLQPHAPFIGPKAKWMRERLGKTIGGLNPGREYTGVDAKQIETTSYQGMLQSSDDVTIEDIRTAYRETLAICMKYIVNLTGALEGKTAISSDHGELLGESTHRLGCRHWEHPRGVRARELCVVPWVECPTDERKSVRADPPKEVVADHENVENRLHALGYVS